MCLCAFCLSASPAPASQSCNESGLFSLDNRDGSGHRLTSLESSYQGVFPEGVHVINTVTARVDWAGKTPAKVVFQLNGSKREVATSNTTAQTTYNMGEDLEYSRSGMKNELAAWAVAADETASQPLRSYFWGLSLPSWAISEETKPDHPGGDPDDPRIGVKFEPLTGKATFYGEVEVLKGGIKGTVNIPNRIPEVGGKWGLEIDPLNFEWELAAQPRFGDGAGLTGSFELGGAFNAEARCGTNRKGSFDASLTGAGEFYPHLRLTDVSAEVAASFTALFPRVPLLCQWSGCCHTARCPYFQASIRPQITGTLAMEEGEPALIAGLKFKDVELNLAATLKGTVGMGSEGSIYNVQGAIGGTPYITFQFPADSYVYCWNEYIKEVGFYLSVETVLEVAWWKRRWDWEFEILKCPDGEYMPVFREVSGGEVRTVEREYLNAGEAYCAFPDGKLNFIESVDGMPAPVLNVGSGPMPSLDATSDQGLLLFVYDDAAKPTGKHQEIYWARWTGTQWTEHAPLTDNLGPDLQPVAAIDNQGTELAVWVSGPEPSGTETGPRDILPGLEIVWSARNPGSGQWIEPVNLTSNGYADMLPWFEKLPGGGLRVCWIRSATNAIPVWHDEEIVPSLDVMASDWNSIFGARYVVASGLQAVSPPSIVRTTTHEFLAYLYDSDGNSGTADDREVMVRGRQIGQSWGTDQQLTSDTLSDTAAQLASDASGVPMLVWVKRLVPKTLPDETETHVDQLWYARWNGLAWDAAEMAFEADGIAEPKLIRNSAGRVVLFWVAASEAFSDIYYSVYDTAAGQWGLPQQVTHDQGAETMLSLAETGGDILAAFVKRRIDLTDPSGVPQIGLSDLHLLKHSPTRDLSVSAATITLDPAPVVRGEDATVCAEVRLSGDFTVEDVLIEFYDGDPAGTSVLIGSQTISAMLPGETAQACATWTVPDDGQGHEIHVVVDPDNTIPETDDTGNNAANVGVFGPDLKVDGPHFLGCPSANTVLVGFTVRNVGSAAAGASTSEVRKQGDTGTALFSSETPALEAGGSSSYQFAWDVTAELQGRLVMLLATVDITGQVSESNESNNVGSAEIPVQFDLQAEQWSVQAQQASAGVLVRNIGAKPSTATSVRVTHAGQTVGEAALSGLAPGAETELTIPLSGVSAGDSLLITANPDTDGSDEVTLLNNAVPTTACGSADDCSPPVLQSAVSERTHGTVGAFAVDLPLEGAAAVEGRTGGPAKIVLTYSEPVTAGQGSASVGTLSDGPGPNQKTVTLSGVADQSCLELTVSGVIDAVGNPASPDHVVRARVLAGDVNADGAVNIFDLIATRNTLNQAVTAGNFRNDMNADGAINIFDLIAIRNSLNHAVADCP